MRCFSSSFHLSIATRKTGLSTWWHGEFCLLGPFIRMTFFVGWFVASLYRLDAWRDGQFYLFTFRLTETDSQED